MYIAVALIIALIRCMPAFARTPPDAIQIKHVVFILKENHTFDNYFGAFPGTDGASSGKIHTGHMVPMGHAPDKIPADISHSSRAALLAMDDGRMDRFDLIRDAFQEGRLMNYTQYGEDQIPNYWALARHFVLADEFFTSVHGPSFPNHLFTIAAQSGGAVDNPSQFGSWGCDAVGETVPVIDSDGKRRAVPACFDFPTLADSLDAAGLSWRYYGAPQGTLGYLWSPFDAIRHIRRGPKWNTNVLPVSDFAADLRAGRLATMTWITTDTDLSEHPAEGGSCQGENSTVRFVNAIMNSSYWDSSVIFISWDDVGGFYDHVPPRQLDALGLGPRVPLLIVPPFAKSGRIEHTHLEFSSVVKFIEEVFGLPFLTMRDRGANDMFEAFDFVNEPLPPMPLQTRQCP
jgi:phospholipase C